MRKTKGYIQVYTGNGKGKTSAALGLCLRAAGAKMKSYIGQFMKLGYYSEIKAIKMISNFITIEQFGNKNFIYNTITENDINKAKIGILSIKEKSSSGLYDIVVLDEINVAIKYKIIPISDLIDIIQNKAFSTEIIITGRDVHPKIIELADLITEMKEIKHYYKNGVQARIGIEK